MTITVYSNGEVFIPDKLLGFIGETVRTVTFSQPTVTNATNYVLRLLYKDGLAYDIPILSNVATLPATALREAGHIKGQWMAYAVNSSDEYTLVAKSKMFDLIIGDSITDDVSPIPPYEAIMGAVEQLVTDGMTRGEVVDLVEQTIGSTSVAGFKTAAIYSSSVTYAVNDVVVYNGVLYTCATAVMTAEAFDSTKWGAVTNPDGALYVQPITTAAYEAITTKDSRTLYILVG